MTLRRPVIVCALLISATIAAPRGVGAAESAALEVQGLQPALELIAFEAAHAGGILEQGGGILRPRRPLP